jgi:hypothetical protein
MGGSDLPNYYKNTTLTGQNSSSIRPAGEIGNLQTIALTACIQA